MNKKDVKKLFENAIEHWRKNKGIGSVLIPHPLDDKTMIPIILNNMYNKKPNTNTIIIVKDFGERKNMVNYLTTKQDEETNERFKNLILDKAIKVFTLDFLSNSKYFVFPDLFISYNVEEDNNALYYHLQYSKFKLFIMNKLILNTKVRNEVYNLCPILNDFKQNEVDEIRVSTPVEEVLVPITIPEDTEVFRLLKYYNEYITTTINIFGSIENINRVRTGDKINNISSNQLCNQIALDNGWHPDLDMSIQYNVSIDSIYNPNALQERANNALDVIRKRSELLSSYEGKLDKILDIVREHKDKKILIINKKGEFAVKVTHYLNCLSETPICGDYNDSVEKVPATDVYGNPIFVKSGEHKGERKYIKAKAQRSLNEQRFNANIINVLSTNNAPDKSLTTNIDVIIITSPLCESIKSYIYRLSDVRYPNGKLLLFSLFCKNSLEEREMRNKLEMSETIIVNNNELNNVVENNYDFIIVD